MHMRPGLTAGGTTILEEGGPNSIAVANGIVGDEWSLWIVQMALNGITQYNEWLRAGPISSSMLTARLGRLVEVNIMERVTYHSRPQRHEQAGAHARTTTITTGFVSSRPRRRPRPFWEPERETGTERDA